MKSSQGIIFLLFRVYEYIRTGNAKKIVDPDPNKERKKSIDGLASPPGVQRVKFPSTGWGTSLEKMPEFSRADMNRHIISSGKNLADKDHHSIPTGLRKAKTFLEDEYLEQIESAHDQRYFYFAAKCCHSFRKNDPPHQLKLALGVLSGAVQSAQCSCVAGKSGYCNHLLALMFKLCKFSLYGCNSTKDLSQESDQ